SAVPNRQNRSAQPQALVVHVGLHHQCLHLHHRHHLHRHHQRHHPDTRPVAACASLCRHRDPHRSQATTDSHQIYEEQRSKVRSWSRDRTKSCRATANANRNQLTQGTRDTFHSHPTPAKQRPPARR